MRDLLRLAPAARVVALTGADSEALVDPPLLARCPGAAAVLAKPFSAWRLRAVVSSVLGTGGPGEGGRR